jgi:hypothetical protein
MAVAKKLWLTYNKGHYVEADIGVREIYLIDVQNELKAGDYLHGCVATTTSTDALIFGATVRHDVSQGKTRAHQQLVVLQPTAVGTHPIKLVSTTANGLTIVKHFDVLTKG